MFLEDLTISFQNGKLYGDFPAPQYLVGKINLDNKPTLNLQVLCKKFVQTDSAKEYKSISIQDSTLVAQLGYYDLNITQVPVETKPNYVKAWFVHPKNSYHAQGYFRDDNGAIIAFTPETVSYIGGGARP